VGRNVLDSPYCVPLRKMRKAYYSERRASTYLLEYAEITVAHLRAGGPVAPCLWARATTLPSHDRPKPSPTTQDTGRCTVGSTDCTLVAITSGGVNVGGLCHSYTTSSCYFMTCSHLAGCSRFLNKLFERPHLVYN
jgi:hypothetical protein